MSNYEWVKCPHCSAKLYRHDQTKREYGIEIACPRCKAIYEISNTLEGEVCFQQVRSPKDKHFPTEFK